MQTGFQLSTADIERLRGRGIRTSEAERQLDLLRNPPPPARLARACRPGDGVTVLSESKALELEQAWDRAAGEHTVVKFVPASGAATRMFSIQGGGDSRPSPHLAELANGIADLPFADALQRRARVSVSELRRRPTELLRLLTEEAGLGLASRPKGLLPFHRYADRARTAFEEHLFEAAGYARGSDASVRVHFTVAAEHREAFEDTAEAACRRAAAATGADFEVGFSTQDPATDTLGLAGNGEPLRGAAGDLVFRPAGHGALLRNLARLDADIVFIKNIDNIAPVDRHPLTATWKKCLGGRLLELRRYSFDLIDRLERGEDATGEASAFCSKHLTLAFGEGFETAGAASDPAFWVDRLDRPLRVCGVVRNVGEPGGGPFWVSDAEGVESGQIIEASQIEHQDTEQHSIFEAATHFNPVDLVCAPHDRGGRSYDLAAYADPATSFVAKKSHQGNPILALERPGLWNGAMAGWNTAFVEVPLATFTPVKTVLDLLRPEHQPG